MGSLSNWQLVGRLSCRRVASFLPNNNNFREVGKQPDANYRQVRVFWLGRPAKARCWAVVRGRSCWSVLEGGLKKGERGLEGGRQVF